MITGKKAIFPKKDVLLDFDLCDLPSYKQWENAIEATSGGSVTTTLLDQDSLTFRAFRGSFAFIEKRPDISNGVVSTQWSIKFRGVVPQPDSGALLLEDGTYYLLQPDYSYILLE